jgi:hypothetical protein
MLWARLCMLGRGVSVPRPSQWPPNSSSRLNFFWSMNSWFCLIFNLPEHSLEGSRLNSCTCVVMRVVMVASSHWNYLNFIYLFLLKWGLFLMVWTRLCTLGMGVSEPRPSYGTPNCSGGLKFFWSMNNWFCLIFYHPEHSLEGSRLNSCTCIVVLVVMVASSYWSYLNCFIFFFSSEAWSSSSGPGCACWGGGLGSDWVMVEHSWLPYF